MREKKGKPRGKPFYKGHDECRAVPTVVRPPAHEAPEGVPPEFEASEAQGTSFAAMRYVLTNNRLSDRTQEQKSCGAWLDDDISKLMSKMADLEMKLGSQDAHACRA